jgi:hypothetical protein
MPAIERPRFTTQQLITANDRVGLITPRLLDGRASVNTHPIDNLPAEVPSDRDDGIYVEAQKHGDGYRVHVTIADVAAHVPLSHVLADAPRLRAFTVYRPWMIDPMFPKPLEERLSLEHGKERLGMNVVIDLDKNFNPIHTEFQKVVTHANSMDYKTASQGMQSDPQLKLMARIAHGVQYSFFRDQDINAWDENQQLSSDKEGQSASENAAQRMVGVYMMLANYCVAQYFNRANLPYLYRNFDEKHLNSLGQPRAYYSPECTKHTDMEKQGLNGAYGHNTSPIRRAPDYYNGHMMHYVIRQIDIAKGGLKERFPEIDEAKASALLWQKPEQILALENAPRLEALLQIAGECGITPTAEDKTALEAIVETMADMPPPISKETLADYALRINEMNWHEQEIANSDEVRLGWRDAKRFGEYMGTLEGIGESNDLSNYPPEKFSSLLKKAAVTGTLPAPLFHEALHRIQEKTFDSVPDSLSIMLLAQWPDNPNWIRLKKAVSLAIKHEPATIENILTMAVRQNEHPTTQGEKYFPYGLPVLSEAKLLLSNGDDDQKHYANAAIYTIPDENGRLIGPPYYSIGHNSRSARSHAAYSLIENIAFGQLQPIEQTAVPDPLFAELNHQDKSKREILERMLQKSGADLVIRESYSPRRGYISRLQVSGGSITEPIYTGATGETIEKAQEKAIRRLLRDETFRNSMIHMTSWETHRILFPRQELQAYADEHDLEITHNLQETRRRSTTSHIVTLTVRNPDTGETLFNESAHGPNRDRAMNEVSASALHTLGVLNPDEHRLVPNARSWVSDNSPNPLEPDQGNSISIH